MRRPATLSSTVRASDGARNRVRAVSPEAEPALFGRRVHGAILAAAVIIAAAVVWAVGLGVLDRVYVPRGSQPYVTSPTARVERRPVLFAVRPEDGNGAIGVAIPIASIDPDGALQPPLGPGAADQSRLAEATAFAETYCADGAPLRVLYGGTFAGTLRFKGAADLTGPLPAVRVGYDRNEIVDVVESASDDLLGISDPRFGAASSGARPMRAVHRAAVDQMTHAAVRERYPNWQVESFGEARVRVADLDRSGTSEILASSTVRLRADARRETTVAIFMIGEAAPPGSAEPFRLAYVASRETAGTGDGFVFLDQVDLTSAVFDEVVVRSDEGGAARYLVLERGPDGWREAIVSPPVSVP